MSLNPDFAVFRLLTSFEIVKIILLQKRRKARLNRAFRGDIFFYALDGRGDRTRTCGILVPNQALYQTELHLGDFLILHHPTAFVKKKGTYSRKPAWRWVLDSQLGQPELHQSQNSEPIANYNFTLISRKNMFLIKLHQLTLFATPAITAPKNIAIII